MLPILYTIAVLPQTPPSPGISDSIASAFSKVFDIKALETSLLQKTIKGQLTILVKNGDAVVLLVYNYRTTIGKTPSEYRSEGTLKVGLETKLRPMLVVSDGKNIVVCDETKNTYAIGRAKTSISANVFLMGFIPSICLARMQNRVADLSVPQISDTQAAVEALAILPKLFAQQGLSSFRTQQESDGRYTLLMGIAKAENLANPSAFSLTLNPHQSHLERFRAEVALEEKASITLTEVVESITNAGPLPAFAFQIPRRAKKVKELAPLLDSL